jgi:signal transduction histidine kinase
MNDLSLKEAFTLFSEESKRLEKAYSSLQKEFNERTQDLSHIVSHLNEGLIFVSLDKKITLFNPAAESLTGTPATKALNTPYSSCFHDELFGFSMMQAIYNQRLNKKIFLTLNNGKEITVSASFIPGRGVVCVLDEKLELERSVERNERLKELGEVAAGLAHEIRNPLGGIEGFAALLCRDLKGRPDQLQMAEKILEGTKSLNRLVTNILNYAKPLAVHFVECDLISLISQVLDLFSHDKLSLPCRFETQIPFLKITCDPELLKMALLNLLRNACEASDLSDTIVVALEMEGQNALISVTDHGKGILPENIKHLFTPFFTTKATGTGLGLTEVYKALHAMGSVIDVESTPAIKTTFTIKLRGTHGN